MRGWEGGCDDPIAVLVEWLEMCGAQQVAFGRHTILAELFASLTAAVGVHLKQTIQISQHSLLHYRSDFLLLGTTGELPLM